MVKAQCQLGDLADLNLVPVHSGLGASRTEGEDCCLAGIQDWGAGVDAKHPHVGDGDGAVSHLGGGYLPGPGRLGQVTQGACEVTQPQPVRILNVADT